MKHRLIAILIILCGCSNIKENKPIKEPKLVVQPLLAFIFENKLDSFFYRSKPYIFSLTKNFTPINYKSKINPYPLLFIDTLGANSILKDSILNSKNQLLYCNLTKTNDEVYFFIIDWEYSMVHKYTFRRLDPTKIKFLKYDDFNPKFSYPQPFNNKSVEESFYK